MPTDRTPVQGGVRTPHRPEPGGPAGPREDPPFAPPPAPAPPPPPPAPTPQPPRGTPYPARGPPLQPPRRWGRRPAVRGPSRARRLPPAPPCLPPVQRQRVAVALNPAHLVGVAQAGGHHGRPGGLRRHQERKRWACRGRSLWPERVQASSLQALCVLLS